jgi:acyl-CoA thioester hydrolase
MHIEYKKAARYDELLTVKMWLTEMPITKLHHRYEIYNEQNKLLADGSTTLAFVNKETGRPFRTPETMLDVFSKHF